ncbi:MAG: porin [Pseudomonadota bacterium]
MKKVLFATTALIATTGMAAAEVTLGGFGRFGLIYDENNEANGNDETRIEQRFRLTVTGTAESDAGVKFEGRIRFQTDDQSNGNSSITETSAAGFAVTAGGFRLDVGSVSDVIDSGDVVDYYGFGVGLTSFAEQSSAFGGIPASGFGTVSSPDDDVEEQVVPTVKLRYTAGDFTVSASVSDGLSAQDNTAGTFTDREEYQLGVGYTFGDYSVGAAFGNEEETDETGATTLDNDFWVISFGGELGAFAFSILVGDSDTNDETMYGLSVKYDINDATDIRFVFSDSGLDADDEVVAIGFRHSLGGGVSLRGGIGQGTDGDTIADLGVNFDF